MPVTRDDAARQAGMSPALVSYVINNGPRPVSAAARERILAAIVELGWQPDGVARNLRTGKSHLLGLVVPDIGLPYFAEMTMRLMRLAYDRGYQLLVSASEWDADARPGSSPAWRAGASTASS